MRFFLTFILTIFLVLPFSAKAQVEGIAAVVNEDVITFSDLNDRLQLVAASSGLRVNEEIAKRLTPQVLGMLIEEQLKLQESERLGIEVSDENIRQGMAQLAAQNNMPVEQFEKSLEANNISPASMKRQIRAQIAWNSVAQVMLQPKITVSDTDVDEVMERYRNAIGKEEYLASEIFLPVDEPKEEADARQLASQLITEMREKGVPFFRLAQQFSKAPGAPKGGDMGWVSQGQLAEELENILSGMEKGQISMPVKTLEGYHILLLRDKRTVTEDTLPSRHQITQDLGLERMERLARRHLLDLKSAAFIEQRIQP